MSVRIGDSIRRRRGHRTRPAAKRGFPWARWLVYFAITAAIAFGAGYVVSAYVLFPAPEQPTDGIPVPALTGRSLRDAEHHLQQAGLALGDVEEIPHPSVPAGIIVAQSPVAGQQLRPGASVGVGVSAGPVRVAVPDVTGFRAARAAALAARLGFTVEEIQEESLFPAGQVIRVEPEPGTSLQLPATIVLVISAGPPQPEEEELLGVPVDTLEIPPSADTLQHGTREPPG